MRLFAWFMRVPRKQPHELERDNFFAGLYALAQQMTHPDRRAALLAEINAKKNGQSKKLDMKEE